MKKLLSIILCMAIILPCIGAVSFAEEANSSYPEYTAEIMKAKGGANAIVSMTFDDGNYNTAVYLNDVFGIYGLKGSCMMIASRVNDTNIASWEEVFGKGILEPQSHTMTHMPLPADDWASVGTNSKYLVNNTPENYQSEIVDSKTMLEQYFPDNDILTFAPSNNTLSDGAYEVVCDTYHAVRSGSRGLQSLDPTFGTNAGSWHNLYMQSLYMSGSPTRAQELCELIDRCVNENLWFVSMCHGIELNGGDITSPEAEIFFEHIAKYQNEGKLWCTTFSEAVKYVRERQNSAVTEYENENGLFVELTMSGVTEDGLTLDADVFNYPLTVKAQLPKDWKAVSYTQGETHGTAVAFEEDGNTYAYIDLVPNGGVAKLSEMDKETRTLSASGSYGESGKNEGVNFDDKDTLLVSGRKNTYTVNANKKAYASLSLEGFESGVPAVLGISVSSDVSGDIYVYGVKEGAENWSADSINYINAPANDRFGAGVNSVGVFSGAALGKISVTGAGVYSLDVSNYAEYMYDAGESSVTLIFTADPSAASAQSIEFEIEEEPPAPDLGGYSYLADIEDLTAASHTNVAGPLVTGKVTTWSGIDADSSVALSTTENHTAGGEKSIHMNASQSWQKFHLYNIIDSLTEADIGRKFNVSFYLKASRTGSFKVEMTAYGKATTTAAQVFTVPDTEWNKYTLEVVISEDMVTNVAGCLTIQMSGFSQSATNKVDIYIDDISSKEVVTSGETPVSKYSYKDTVEGHTTISHTSASGPIVDGKIMTWAGFEADAYMQISTEENHTLGGSKSVLMHSTKTYNRLYLFNMVDSLTEADIGRTFRTSFYMKADRAGSFKLEMTSKAAASAVTCTLPEADTWTRFSYDVVIDSDMVENTKSVLTLMMSGFKQSPDDPVDIYLDDFSSVELIDGEQQTLSTEACASVLHTSTEAGVLKVSKATAAEEIINGIHKAYFRFTPSDYENTKKATLSFNITEANGQLINVYGVTDGEYPEALTYLNAPAYKAAEGADREKVRGGTSIARVNADSVGEYTIDVSDYVKSRGGKDYIFILTVDELSGSEYTVLDFEGLGLTNGVDYVSDSDITITDGAAQVSGGRIQLKNAFGNGNASVKAGEVYKISADVTASGSVVIAACDGDGNIGGSATYSLDGAEQTIELNYTATEQDEAAGICNVVIECTNAGFTIDNFSVASENNVVLEKTAVLMVDNVKEVVVTISTIGGSGVTINGVNKGSATTERVTAGTVLNMTASGDGEFLYWIDTNLNTILSYNESYSFTAGSDRSLAAVYADKTEVFVTFTSMGNKLVASGIASSITVPADPYVYGYKFSGWYAGGEKTKLVYGGAVSAEANTEFKAGFAKDTTAYTVTVDGVSDKYTYNEKVTASTEAEKDGKAFSYWVRDSKIVSYSPSYSFYVSGDTTVKSVYGESAAGDIILVMAAPVLVEGSKLAFFAERDIPDSYTVIEAGIIMGTEEKLTVDNAPYKAVAKSTANKGQYTVRKANVVTGDVWYGAAYAIYRDADGNIVTAYSNEVSYTVE